MEAREEARGQKREVNRRDMGACNVEGSKEQRKDGEANIKTEGAHTFNTEDDASYYLYSHIWSKFCDWYIEFSKPLFSGLDEEIKLETQQTYAWVFEQCLIMLHPFMPFITEEIWLQKKNSMKNTEN